MLCSDPDEVMGVNSRYDLSRAEDIIKQRTNRRWMREGVALCRPDTVFIGSEVSIGHDVTLYPNVRIEGRTKIGDTCMIYPGTPIVDSVIASHVTIKDYSLIEESSIATGAVIGHFSTPASGALIGNGVHIEFVEVKKSAIGKGGKGEIHLPISATQLSAWMLTSGQVSSPATMMDTRNTRPSSKITYLLAAIHSLSHR